MIVVAVLQLAALISLNLLGRWLCATLHLPLPGNVLGMLMLFALLSLRVVRLEWFEPTARLFNRHLALFFIPLVVGLLALPSSLIRSHGLALLVIIIVTAVVGVATTGGIATWLERQSEDEQ